MPGVQQGFDHTAFTGGGQRGREVGTPSYLLCFATDWESGKGLEETDPATLLHPPLLLHLLYVLDANGAAAA